jgi:hypothetical protein
MDLANLIRAKFPLEEFKKAGFKITFEEYEMGSLHRHPGDFGFSTTDLDNQTENPGIIFRNADVQDKVQVDSVMYIPSGYVKLNTTETRVVNVQPDEKGIRGSYLRAPTITYIIQEEVDFSSFKNFFGAVSEDKINFVVQTDRVQEDYPEIEALFEEFLKEFDYEPLQYIRPELISSLSYRSYSYGYNYNPATNRKPSYHADALDVTDGVWGTDWEDDFETEEYETEATKELFRPSWRKMQTKNRLKFDYKVNLDQEPMISGDASEKDIIAIAQALKFRRRTDKQIKKFFEDNGYPDDAMDIFYKDLK